MYTGGLYHKGQLEQPKTSYKLTFNCLNSSMLQISLLVAVVWDMAEVLADCSKRMNVESLVLGQELSIRAVLMGREVDRSSWRGVCEDCGVFD